MKISLDFRNETCNPTQEDWGQGFTLRFQSGFT